MLSQSGISIPAPQRSQSWVGLRSLPIAAEQAGPGL